MNSISITGITDLGWSKGIHDKNLMGWRILWLTHL